MRVMLSFVLGTLSGAAALSVAIAVTQSESDPVKQSPQYYTVRIDNERLRVLEYRLGPGQKESKHSHPPGIVYTLADAKMKVQTFPDGAVTVHDYHAGDLTWRDAVTHAAENVGTTEVHAIAVELKPCKQP
jgi:beta-alanine degradation protein BauB